MCEALSKKGSLVRQTRVSYSSNLLDVICEQLLTCKEGWAHTTQKNVFYLSQFISRIIYSRLVSGAHHISLSRQQCQLVIYQLCINVCYKAVH